ncbi:hypothetical protein Ocin01_07971 [Orchesella cincta]|uniref:Uncharacterized protein n=1 Tax=Orchesella cincta TaxID=48709 RepID=A0A1D2N0E6_ORCCI|nr:hypothetical protein Ocin01_07971 [Orchesella cincta]
MLKILIFTAVSSIFAAAFSEITAKEISAAIVPELKVVGVLGQSVNITCKSERDYKLRSCRWERLNTGVNRYFININSHGISEGGLEEFHAAMWECFLIGKPVDHSWIGRLTVELTRFEPYFLNTADFNITYDEASSAAQNITCCVANAAKIPVHFQLDFGNDTFSKYDLIRKEKDITCATTTYKFFPQNNENEDSYIQIKDNEKYAMTYVSLEGDNYRATVKVKNVNEEDLNRKFKLRISNAHGDKELSFQIVSPDPGDESDTYWLMILIGIGAMILCLVFFAVLFVIISKKLNSGGYAPTVVRYSNQANRDSEIATVNSVGRT